MDLQDQNIYQKALEAQSLHTKFLEATEKNLSYYFFGKTVPLVKKLTFPQIDLVQALANYSPEPYNPLAYLIDGFIDEIANSGFVTSVNPYPVKGKEPYQSYADSLEDYLIEVHRKAKREKFLKASLFEILAHSYFSLFTDGRQYWFLTAYDFIPGDEAISNLEDQPFVIRRTQIRKAVLKQIKGIDLEKEELSSLEVFSDLDNVPLLDVWIKPLDLNICFTGAGQVLYKQKFRQPKRYPFAVGSETELLNSFYSKPLMSSLSPLLLKHQDSFTSVEESSKSIATPILLYDADAGIDVNALQRALKEGYKRIIIGKNREGNISFRAPGHLPAYALDMPDIQIKEMMKHLGISETFFGVPTKGVRERGALGRLMKTAFRKLGSMAAIAESAFIDLDNYLLDYAQAHQLTLNESPQSAKIKDIEEVFQGDVRYLPSERFKGFSSEDSTESKHFAMLKWKGKLVSQEQTLKEMGHSQPRRLINEGREETKDQQEFIMELKKKSVAPSVSLLEIISNRLKGKLRFRFYLMPIADEKVLVRCGESDQKMVAFCLSDISVKVLIEIIPSKAKGPEQASPEVKTEKPEPEPEKEKLPEVKEETRGRPRETLETPEEETKKSMRELGKIQKESSDKKLEKIEKSDKLKEDEKPKEESEKSLSKFSEDRLKVLIRRSHIIRKPERYFNLPGFYLAEPHAKWVFTGKKSLIVKAKSFDIKNKLHLLCGKDYVYGVIIIRDIISDFDISATQKFHLVSPSQAKRWWKGLNLYLYMFEFHPFEKPLEYDRPQGVQTFLKKVEIKEQKDIGLPFKGDLKPIGLSPFKIPPPHKPEKKAFQPHEVFSIKRLIELIPEATYDVSEKIDGLRSFAWIKDSTVKMFSDVGNKFPENRVKPLLEDLGKLFKHDALIDGELVMEGIRRKDVAGYIHGKWNPTSDQLKSLRYICWDILYIKDRSIASLPFHKRSAVLDLYLPKGCKGSICRVKHIVAKRDKVGEAVKKIKTPEGAVIRDINASYWATHSTYKCLHGDTLIITKRGLIAAKKVLKTDLVLSKDGKYHSIKSIVVRKPTIKDKILEITPWGGLSFKVTEDHRVLTLNGWKEAKDLKCISGPLRDRQNLKKVDFVALPKFKINSSPIKKILLSKPHNYLKSIKPDLEFWWTIGLWIGDGSKNRTGTISIAGKKEDLERAKKCLDRILKIKSTISKYQKGCHSLWFSDSGFADWLDNFKIKYSTRLSEAFSKTLPDFINSLSEKEFNKLFEGWCAADKGTTVDRDLALQIYLIGLSKNMPLSIKRYYQPQVGTYYMYRIILFNTKKNFGLKQINGQWYARIKTIKKVKSRSRLYDFEVEGENSFTSGAILHNCKNQFDVDAKVYAVIKTKTGLPMFCCELKDGTLIGSTYAQSEVVAKVGDVIRVNVDHVSIRPDGSVNWYAPKPKSWKEGKITPKKVSTTQVGIGGADNIDLIKEIYLVTGGTKEKWNAWHPSHLKWKKEKMSALKEKIKKEIKRSK